MVVCENPVRWAVALWNVQTGPDGLHPLIHNLICLRGNMTNVSLHMFLGNLDGRLYQCKKKDRNWQQHVVAIKTCSEVAKTIIAIKLVVTSLLVYRWNFIIYRTKTFGVGLIWRSRWSFESLRHAAPSGFEYAVEELLHASPRVRNQNYSFGVRASRQASGGCYCCLSVSRRDTTVCWQPRKTDYRFCQHAARDGKSEVMNARLFGKTACNKNKLCGAGRCDWSSARCISAHKNPDAPCASLNHRMFENCGVLKERKKNATAKLLLSKKIPNPI